VQQPAEQREGADRLAGDLLGGSLLDDICDGDHPGSCQGDRRRRLVWPRGHHAAQSIVHSASATFDRRAIPVGN